MLVFSFTKPPDAKTYIRSHAPRHPIRLTAGVLARRRGSLMCFCASSGNVHSKATIHSIFSRPSSLLNEHTRTSSGRRSGDVDSK